KLDLYMFEEVCREIPIRHDNNLPLLPVSINFSRQDFDHADIVSEMNRMFDKYKLSEYVDKSYFIIEITEQDLAVKEERFQEQLKRLHDDGYRIWLDDFGSGYSALNMFNRFNFDMVKFDMDLLRHLDDNGGVNRIILKELVKLVRELNIHSLIEGVETQKQLDFVKEIGFELAQGFFFSRPESLDEILFRIRDGEAVKIYETHDELEWMSRK
ncbi:MAG: EAL domain-containing protein, partial [Lachnospiraceae bacterium]|nr:EAL domain-containing protein [Lachnospiraceae bacterium]